MVEAQEPSGRAQGLVDLVVPKLGDWAAVRVERDGEPVLLATAGAVDGASGEDRLIEHPLSGDGWSGMLEVGRSPAREPFHEEDRSLATDLADRAGLALDIALLLDRQRGVARELQMSLLAGDPPDCDGIAFARSYHPAVEWLEVGGDFYDTFEIAPGRLAIVVGDVVGRGLPAASAMGQLRSAIRGLALGGDSPVRVLDGLDRFVELAPGCRFATVAYGSLDVRSRRLEFACAGHPPPLVLLPGGRAQLAWEGRSAPLGIVDERVPRPHAELELEPGSALLLYTDGLIEARREPIDVGLQRLLDAAERAHGLPAQRLVDALVNEVLAVQPAHDDICALLVDLREAG
jgi:serine/threonine-protein kinase RsbW